MFPNAKKVPPFDSILELQWAYLLDQLSIPFVFHPGSITLPNGERYEPDFLFPESNQLFEVKGAHHERIHKVLETAKLSQELIVVGHPPYIPPLPAYNNLDHAYAAWTPSDAEYLFLTSGYGFEDYAESPISIPNAPAFFEDPSQFSSYEPILFPAYKDIPSSFAASIKPGA